MDGNISILNKLVLNFYRGYLHFTLEENEIRLFDWALQEKFLEATVKSETFKRYPCSSEFCRLFFKKLISYLEPFDDIHDDIYSFLCTSMNYDKNNESFCYRHYIIDNNLNNIITMKETKNMVVNGTTGMKTWEASLMLTDFILSNKHLIEDKYILELGSGIGFAGITLSRYCFPRKVIMTDCHRDVLKGICENIEINYPDTAPEINESCTFYKSGQTNIGVMPLDWNNIDELPDNILPDVIIGADIVYDPSILDILCSTIKHFFKGNQSLNVYIASIIRNENTFAGFLQALKSYGMEYSEAPFENCVHLIWDSSVHRKILRIYEK